LFYGSQVEKLLNKNIAGESKTAGRRTIILEERYLSLAVRRGEGNFRRWYFLSLAREPDQDVSHFAVLGWKFRLVSVHVFISG